MCAGPEAADQRFITSIRLSHAGTYAVDRWKLERRQLVWNDRFHHRQAGALIHLTNSESSGHLLKAQEQMILRCISLSPNDPRRLGMLSDAPQLVNGARQR